MHIHMCNCLLGRQFRKINYVLTHLIAALECCRLCQLLDQSAAAAAARKYGSLNEASGSCSLPCSSLVSCYSCRLLSCYGGLLNNYVQI